MKQLIRQLLTRLSQFDLLYRWFINRHRFVFLYHGVGNNPSDFEAKWDLCIPTQTFNQQLDFIKQDFTTLCPKEFISVPKPCSAMITFDDGFQNVFTQALKALKARDIKPVIFVNMAPIMEGSLFWSGLIDYLANCEKGRFSGQSMFKLDKKAVNSYVDSMSSGELITNVRHYYGTFANQTDLESSANDCYLGNHLYNHYNATTLSNQELNDAYQRNAEALSNFSNAMPHWFAYPFGQPGLSFNQGTDEIIRQAGAQYLFTGQHLANPPQQNQVIHRINMNSNIKTYDQFRYHVLIESIWQKLKLLSRPSWA